MGGVREEDVVKGSEKKKHKRKHGELEDLGGKGVRDVQLDRKKRKHEGLNGDCASQVVVDVEVGVSEDTRSRKEKKKERRRLKDGDENKSGNGVEEGNLRGEEALDGINGEVGEEKRVNDDVSRGVMDSKVRGEVIEKVKLKKDKKEKKKKNKSEPESKENGDSGSCVSEVVLDVGEGSRCRKEKKKETSRSKGEDPNNFEKMKPKKSGSASGGVDGEEGDGKSANNSVSSGLLGSKVGGELIKRVKLKKDKKEKKKESKYEPESNENGDGGRSDSGVQGIQKVDFVENKKRKKKVTGVDKEEGPLKNDELIDGHKKKKKKNTENDSGASLSESQGCHEAVGSGVSKKRKEKRKEKAVSGVSTINDGNEPTVPGAKSKPSKKSARVSFAESVEVFSLPDNAGEEDDLVDEGYLSNGLENLADPDGVVRGSRYSKEEDEMVKKAVYKYIEDNQLGEEGLEMVLKCKKNIKKVAGCWNVIAAEMPWRSKVSIYSRAHILFERSESHTWSKEELEQVREFYEKHGPKWRTLADEIGRNRIHVKDAFRQVRLANRKDGAWSQDEYQNLFDSVNENLRIRAAMERKTQHGMLRENIGWRDVSLKLGTRTDPICCMKWYDSLTSTLVKSGQWADTDDHRLLMALVELDATCEEEVDWENILEHRPGEVSRKRWNQMVRHIGEHGTKSFSEQVEILHGRYVPDVLEARETYDSKPFVDALFSEKSKS